MSRDVIPVGSVSYMSKSPSLLDHLIDAFAGDPQSSWSAHDAVTVLPGLDGTSWRTHQREIPPNAAKYGQASLQVRRHFG